MTMITDEPTMTTHEVVALVGGVSYRMVDHWLRNGHITLACNQAPGSGNRRAWTSDEVDALRLFVAEYRRVIAMQEAMRDGSLWDHSIRTAEAANA